ncbi:YeeE/YedE thiosulfate transporter family protein [Bacteroidota bacterium]
MAPLLSTPDFPIWLNLLTAVLIGIGFGFALEQAGFSSSRKLTGMFYGYDTTVLKVFFTAAIVALIGAQFLSYFGLIDLHRVFVNYYYVLPAIIGGIIMGVGFVMGGFCPGTGFSALAIGKIDALFYLLGGLLGAWIFAEVYPSISEFANSGFKGPAKINEWLGISPAIFSMIIIMMAIAMFWLAEKAEKKFARPDITNEL